MHVAPLASDVPQVLALTTNSAALALAIAKPLAAAVPVFVIVTERAPLDWPAVTLPNDSAVGDAESDAVPVGTPVPDRPIDIVAPPPVIVYVVLSVTALVGVYVNTIVQVAPALSVLLLHVPDLPNFAGAAG